MELKLDKTLIARLERATKEIGKDDMHAKVIQTIKRANIKLMDEFEETGLRRRVFSKHFQTIRIPVIYGTVQETKNTCQRHEEVENDVKSEHVMAVYHMALAEMVRIMEAESMYGERGDTLEEIESADRLAGDY